tara:strand:- start:290 stop:1015 length:726 start_codon:yes stop_codon:yes gene_type:complete
MATTKVTSSVIGDNEVKTVNILNANVTTDKIADDSVTLDKMASGTDGNLITYDASGNPAAVSTGSLGNVLTSSGAGAPPTMAMPSTITSDTSVGTGNTYDITGIPAGVRCVHILFEGVSTASTSEILVQLGDAGGIETSGYVSEGVHLTNGSVAGVVSSTAGFLMSYHGASQSLSGIMDLYLKDAANFTWVSSHNARVATTIVLNGAGVKSLSAALTQIRITTVNGSQAFDAGTVALQYGY